MPTHILTIGKHASISIKDRIFLGEGLFETIRVEHQRPCYSELHWQRMRQSASALGIPFTMSLETWHEQLALCLIDGGIQNGGIKVILSGGLAPRGLLAHGLTSLLAFDAFTFTTLEEPIKLAYADWLRDAKNPTYQHKSVNYLESILARREAVKEAKDDVLFFNTLHHATETTIANLFMIKQNELLTPKLSDGVLPGIIRERILSIALLNKISCREESIDKTTLEHAEAIFITNALQGIRSVKSLNNKLIPTDHPWIDLLSQWLRTDAIRFS